MLLCVHVFEKPCSCEQPAVVVPDEHLGAEMMGTFYIVISELLYV